MPTVSDLIRALPQEPDNGVEIAAPPPTLAGRDERDFQTVLNPLIRRAFQRTNDKVFSLGILFTKRRQPTTFKCLWIPFAFNGIYRVALARHNEVHLTLLFVAPKMNLWQPGGNEGVPHEVLP